MPGAALVEALRGDLAEGGYTVDGVAELLGPVASAALHREQAVPALRATVPGTAAGRVPAAVLLRLFLLGVEVRRDALAAALPRTGVDAAVRLGLVDRVADPADARARLVALTEAGERQMDAVHTQRLARWRSTLATWDVEDLAQLTGLLRRLEESGLT